MVKWQKKSAATVVWTSSWIAVWYIVCKTDCLWTWMYMTWPNGAVWPNVTKGYKHAYASPEDENASMEKAKAFTAKLKEQGAKEWAKEAKKKKK